MECAICMEDIQTNARVTIEHCGHAFHATCLKTWKNEQMSCPMCRHDLDVGEDLFDMQNIPDVAYQQLVDFFSR